jgi:hypothetical protein
MVSPERRLTPSNGPQRRRVVQTAAIALACAEKAQWAFYEGRVRPAEKIHNPWIEHNDKQVLGGFEHLAMAAANLDDGGWIAGTSNISQADVTTTVAYTFAKLARPNLQLEERFPQLSRFAARCELLPAFSKSPITPGYQLRIRVGPEPMPARLRFRSRYPSRSVLWRKRRKQDFRRSFRNPGSCPPAASSGSCHRRCLEEPTRRR